MGGLLSRVVVFAITAGIVCASAVVFVFGLGLRIPHAWYALIPLAIGCVVLLVLRTTMPKTDIGEETEP